MDSTTSFKTESLPFRDPLLTAQRRRNILLTCQSEWDQLLAEKAGRAGPVSHLTVMEGERAHEFAVAGGEQIPYPPELQEALEQARAWARKRVDRPPALSSS